MCGIIGIISPKTQERSSIIRASLKSLSHRGPDTQTILQLKGCILGHTRLSIVDILNGGQPMESYDKSTAITFNGEIYGYKELKNSLSNYPFTTNSDTEVILALYKQYGYNFIHHIPGMFAFALWDISTQTLICARDRFGEKPFYYAETETGEFIFASEIKAIIDTGLVKPILNIDTLSHYLSFLYINPHTTVYKNIYSLPPAHTLIVKDGKIKLHRYWNLPTTDSNITDKQAIHKFKYLLEKSVQKQLVADVSVGAFLSGGMDSSIIVALASKYKKNLKTFSFEFEASDSELMFAREVSNKFGTEHIELKDSTYNIANLLIEMSEVYDEPFADSSNIPTFIMSKIASKYTKVVLTGDGGDELCGGYSGWYQPLLAYERSALKNKLIGVIYTTLSIIRFPFLYKLKNFKRGLDLQNKFVNTIDAHKHQLTYFTNEDLDKLGLKKHTQTTRITAQQNAGTVDEVLRMDIESYLPGDILTKIDRASMANGLELRAPFLDHEFAEFCISLPQKFKLNSINSKIILRKTFGGLLPHSILKRTKKGFGAPIHHWLNQPDVIKLIEKYLNNPLSKIFKIISFENSRTFVNQKNYHTWILLILAIWLDKHNYSLE